MCKALRQKEFVEFDPLNAEHLGAYKSLIHEGRQHPTLRFELDPTKHTVVPVMMAQRIADQFLLEKGLL
jgi:hypothetical protein